MSHSLYRIYHCFKPALLVHKVEDRPVPREHQGQGHYMDLRASYVLINIYINALDTIVRTML